jgi:hypothetical protein
LGVSALFAIISAVSLITSLTYILVAVRRVYKQSWAVTAIKALVVCFLYIMVKSVVGIVCLTIALGVTGRAL